ncbi:PREDICTED: RNA pseudouridylate synthase domain-containing protein 4-like [Eufriesea mexicana]|uniref:RNA pseudouridylate synthase domain-containing protein 4-like n=1 Tax=Eufriesea mexicana TaxID=516756 RepID=UPI00083C12CE|nr:PREDICTED: RNA pseudouridylate synthase domain-containing protein 4-like [Eufriesea mexicana]
MLVLISKLYPFRCVTALCTKVIKRNYMNEMIKNHPYKHIHPWKSLEEFSDHLLNNMIYNKNGLVVLNKPYGIRRNKFESSNSRNNVPYGANYVLQDAIPYIAMQLNYPNLTIIRSPEMYMSGITLLASDLNVENAIVLAYARSEFFANTYWVITVRVPKKLKDDSCLAIKSVSNPKFQERKNILVSNWSNNEKISHKIKILKTEYEVLSNSTLNLCSLIKLKSSTHNKHAIRLFTSTCLYCPVLGDNIYANLIQKVGKTYVRVDPFLNKFGLPKLDEKLFILLKVNPREQRIIPAHIHLKSIILPKFFGETLTIDAPLMPYFNWTCEQLEFKSVINNSVEPNSSLASKII